MRPVKLVLTAFGPYREAETIDFGELQGQRLFVISGVTGAGKTTLFDAICYALYGFANGEDRAGEARMLRSDFAADDVHTSVDFTFCVGSRTFRVFRQMGHRKAGNKSETGAKAELYEWVNGEEIPIVDRFMLSEVNAKLESLLGLTKDQFSQIVMLPQGEFRKLLTSDTENKEEILRRIFRTELYRKLEERFYGRSRELKERHRDARLKLDGCVAQAGETLPLREGGLLAATLAQPVYSAAQVVAALEEEIACYEGDLAAASESRAALGARIERQEAAWREAVRLNERFAELAAKRAGLRELASQAETFAALERRLQEAERAARIEPYDELAVRAAADDAAKREALADAKLEAERAEAAKAAAEAAFAAELALEPERLAAERELAALAELAPLVGTLERSRLEVEALDAERRTLADRLEAVGKEAESKRMAATERGNRIKALERETLALPDKLALREQLVHKYRLLQELLAAEKQMADYGSLADRREAGMRDARERYERLEAEWLADQAGMLAEHLHEGESCPVCGSVDHPRKAVRGAERSATRDQVQQAMEQWRAAERELTEARTQAAAAQASFADRSDGLAVYGIETLDRLAERKAAVEQEGKSLKSEIEELQNKAAGLGEMRDAYEREMKQLEQGQRLKEELTALLQERSVALATKQTLYGKDLERVPEQLRDEGAFQRRRQERAEAVQRLGAAWKAAQERRERALTVYAEEKTRAEQLARQAEEAAGNWRAAAERLARELEGAGFSSEEAYRAAKLAEAERERYRGEIRAYRESSAALARHVEEFERELAGCQPAEPDKLHAELAASKAEWERLMGQLQTFQHRLHEAGRLRTAVAQADRAVREVETELARVSDIYQMLKGDNALKLSFERYILIEYMEQILHAANARLQQLSNGQFELKLREGTEARGRQSGLGLDVYDAYTGQNRDVKTLSGGEKFNASLSLALGMTDVIQSAQGGVSIEVMFIDEGFGSLDEESLHKAIATLVDLQRVGRMIGVISHVSELKQAFPAVLEVTKTKEGYSKTKFLVKA